jgi:prepilin-type N-terminal cleavage/methylation domain-containing protein
MYKFRFTKNTQKFSAFSLIELSIVVLIIGILIAGVTQGSRLVRQSRIKTAYNTTQNSPVSSIPDLGMWLEAASSPDSIISTTNGSNPEDGDLITTWIDINPQSTTKLQASGTGNPPSFSQNGINGLPSVYFACPSGVSSSCPRFSIPFSTSINSSNYTIFVVTNTTAMVPTFNGVLLYSISSSGGYHLYKANDGRWNMRSNTSSASTNAIFSATQPNNTPVIITGQGTSSTTQIYKNNSLQQSVSGGYQPANSGSLLIGLNNVNEGYNGYISEIIYFSRSLKTSEITDINKYLSQKYNIPLQ